MYKKDQKGFTIIEVLIVLAIAALILLIVFLAVPALQRNNRNTQRKNDVSNVLGAISEFNANKNGRMPSHYNAETGEFLLDNTAHDGEGVTPKIGFYAANEIEFANNNNPMSFTNPIPSDNASRMYVKTGAKCNTAGSDFGGAGASSRTIAVVYVIETSGGSTSVCQES